MKLNRNDIIDLLLYCDTRKDECKRILEINKTSEYWQNELKKVDKIKQKLVNLDTELYYKLIEKEGE